MAHPFQKPLGWLQRFLYNVEHGDLPPLHSTIDIGQDWPLNVERITFSYVTIVGTVASVIQAIDQENHAIVFNLMLNGPVGDLDINDTVQVNYSFAGLGVPLIRYDGGNYPMNTRVLALIGTRSTYEGVGAAAVHIQGAGVDPVYLVPGGSLDIVHTSAVAGKAVQITGLMVRRPKFYPLRLP